MSQPIVVERFASNGEHSHYELVDPETCNTVWWEGDELFSSEYGSKLLKQNEEYEQFIEWLNKKPEYKHIYQQYLQAKYP